MKHIKDQAKLEGEKNTHDGDNKRNSDEINKLRKQKAKTGIKKRFGV